LKPSNAGSQGHHHFSQGFLGRATCDSFAAKGFSTLSLADPRIVVIFF